MKNRVNFLFFIVFFLGCLDISQAKEITTHNTAQSFIHLAWKGDRTVTYCAVDSIGRSHCQDAEMPKNVGLVEKFIGGNFISVTKPNWLAATDTGTSLCILANVGVVLCHPVTHDREYQNYDLTYQDSALKISTLLGARKQSSPDELAEFSKKFAKSLGLASSKLLLELKKNVNAKLNKPIVKKPGASEAHTDSEVSDGNDPGGGGGGGDDGGGDGGGGDGGGGDMGGGGDFGGGATCSPAGCIVIIPPPPPSPTEPKLPSPPATLCSMFGIFCNTPPPSLPDPVVPSTGVGDSSMGEAMRCQQVRSDCRAACSDATLPTPPGNDGMDFYRCINKCIADAGCP